MSPEFKGFSPPDSISSVEIDEARLREAVQYREDLRLSQIQVAEKTLADPTTSRKMKRWARRWRRELKSKPPVDPEEVAATLRACKTFLGACSPDEATREFYRARALNELLASPTVSEERKNQLQIEKGSRIRELNELLASPTVSEERKDQLQIVMAELNSGPSDVIAEI